MTDCSWGYNFIIISVDLMSFFYISLLMLFSFEFVVVQRGEH